MKLTRLNIASTELISSIATLSIKGPKIGILFVGWGTTGSTIGVWFGR